MSTWALVTIIVCSIAVGLVIGLVATVWVFCNNADYF